PRCGLVCRDPSTHTPAAGPARVALDPTDPVDAVVLRHATWDDERAAIRPVTVADACGEYADRLRAMTDEQVDREAARVEALPGCEFRRLAAAEFDRRHPIAGGAR